jgi:pyruvate kinase
VQDCRPGDDLLLDDGRIVLRVDRVQGDSVATTVMVGGPLSDNKGINRRGGGLSAPSLTDKDRADIQVAAALQLDYVAVSFPRHGSDIEEARELVRAAGSGAWIIAKIERAEAVVDDNALDALIRASDGVMVARGDLGVEVGDAELAGIQKRIIQHARRLNKFVITATQMMESMISNPVPTRAEVSDVANAVLDYTDAVMLSAESASGAYPVEAVAAMARVCLGAEKHSTSTHSHHRLGETFLRCDATIALAAMYAANHFHQIKAIIALTESGHTPLIMSRIRSGVPIYCYSRHSATQNRAVLFRGVYTVPFDPTDYDPAELSTAAIQELKKRDLVQPGDWVILTKGDFYRDSGGTNGLKLLPVE